MACEYGERVCGCESEGNSGVGDGGVVVVRQCMSVWVVQVVYLKLQIS